MRLQFAAALAMGIVWAHAAAAQEPPAVSSLSQPSASILTQNEAVSRALERAPRAAAAAARLRADDANVDQAGVWPNPEISVEGSEERGGGEECVSTCKSRW